MITFCAMGTEWWIDADGVAPMALRDAEALVRREEERLSRFLDTSLLSVLNRERRVADQALADLVGRALELRADTCGAFDPGVGGAVVAAGYDAPFAEWGSAPRAVRPPGPTPGITVAGDAVTLEGDGWVDLGGIAKGWTVDRVSELLSTWGAERSIVDGGGDIRVVAPTGAGIGLGVEGYAVRIREGAVATSSTLRRRWATAAGEMHHIITPGCGRPCLDGHVIASVVAPDAATADALATALLADAPRALRALVHHDAAAFLMDRQGACVMTPNLRALLR